MWTNVYEHDEDSVNNFEKHVVFASIYCIYHVYRVRLY